MAGGTAFLLLAVCRADLYERRALTLASSAKHLPKRTTLVFRPFLEGALDSEMQLVFPKGLHTPAVLAFVHVATRMVRRMQVASVGTEAIRLQAAS